MRKINYLFTLILYITTTNLSAQTVVWSGLYGDAAAGGTKYDQGYGVAKLNDGTVVSVGFRESAPTNGAADIFTVSMAYDGSGATERNYGANNTDKGQQIIAATDGNAVICGQKDGAAYVAKLNSAGTILWQYSSTGTVAYDVSETADAGFVVTGNKTVGSNKDLHLFKVDASGALVFEYTFAEAGEEIGEGVVETPNNEFIVVGSKNPTTAIDAYALRINAAGTLVWQKTFDGSSTQDFAFDVIKVAGSTEAYAFTGILNDQFYIIKIDASGNTVFNTQYTQPGFNSSKAYSISQKTNGNFILAGICSASTTDGLVLETSSTGAYIAYFRVGSPDYHNTIEGAYLVDDDNLLVSGYENDWQAYPDMYVARISMAAANTAPVAVADTSTTAFNTAVTTDVLANDSDDVSLNPASVTVTVASPNGTTSVNTTNGAITFTPTTGFSGTTTYTYQVCDNASPALCATAVVTITVSDSSAFLDEKSIVFALFPNPATAVLTISAAGEVSRVKILTLDGKELINSSEKTINVASLTNGIYQVEVRFKNGTVGRSTFVRN